MAHGEAANPEGVEGRVDGGVGCPGAAVAELAEGGEEAIAISAQTEVAPVPEDDVAAVKDEGKHEGEGVEVVEEVLVVPEADAVAHPGTVVVEARHAAVAHGAVLGAEGAADQARVAEDARVKALPLGQLDDGPELLLLAG